MSENLQGRRLKSIFFGGGTPSLMEPETISKIVHEANSLWQTDKKLEITMEANPSSVESESLELFRDAGINRLSLGVQSFDDEALRFLGRGHTAEDAIAAIEKAHALFDNISFDLIYARPHQSLRQWMSELASAISLAGNHLSVYQLTIERGTQFFRRHKRGEFQIPDSDESGLLYEATVEKLHSVGLPDYEISNHARPGSECLHNLQYWETGDYLGIGAGAHSRITTKNGQRFAFRTHSAPNAWLQKAEMHGHAIREKKRINAYEQLVETLMMGLRLTKGLPVSRLESISGLEIEELFPSEIIGMLTDQGLLEITSSIVRATPSGRQRLDGLIGFLLENTDPGFQKSTR
ncbi:MAG: coproporphyrinogen III oxidase [Rhodospirillaceae bacterium]|nr:coproporphyrinogen III oxidase [Rhodospirillaceae bacterium]